MGFWGTIWKQFQKRRLNLIAFYLVVAFALIGLYAPFLASSKPFTVYYDGHWFFPFFRYLFYSGFYTKRLDLFFNILMFTFPLAVAAILFVSKKAILMPLLMLLTLLQIGLFILVAFAAPKDPEADPNLARMRQEALSRHPLPSWSFDLYSMTPYARLNLLLRERQKERHNQLLQRYAPALWQAQLEREKSDKESLEEALKQAEKGSSEYQMVQAKLKYQSDRQTWIKSEM